MRHKKWLRKIFFCMALSCVTATGAMATGSFFYTGNGTEDISVLDDITNSTTGTDPIIPGALVDNLLSFTFDATMTIEANGGDTNATAVGVYAYNTGTLFVDGIITASATASVPSALGIVATNSGTMLNTAQITAYSNGTDTFATGIYTLNSVDLNNTGTISSTAIGTESADAHGISVVASSGNITNSGNITTTSENNAVGIFAFNNTGAISNSAAIIASARSESSESIAQGIAAYDTGAISNSGDITASASSESSESRAVGIAAYDTDAISNVGDITASSKYMAVGIDAMNTGAISNAGDITALASSESAMSWALGIAAYDTGAISNSGDITTTSENISVGIYAFNNTGAISNSAAIIASARSESDLFHDGVKAIGIEADNVEGIINTNSILATAESNAFARARGIGTIYDEGDQFEFYMNSAKIGIIRNEGRIVASAVAESFAEAYGIDVLNAESIINTAAGSIEAHANGSFALAIGIFSLDFDDDDPFTSIINEGLITAEAKGVFPMADGIVGHDVGLIRNAGKITVNAMALEATEGEADSEARGIIAAGVSRVENTGVIAVNSDFQGDGIIADDSFYYFDEDASWRSVVNNGFIYMNASTGAGIAINSGLWDVYNPGFIHTGIGNDMRTLTVGMEEDFAAARLVDDFRIIFDGVPCDMGGQSIRPENAYLPQILVGHSGELHLNDATLVAQAGKNIAWNTPYRVIENRYEEEGESGEGVPSNANISGEFAALKNPNPNINVSWVDSDETGANAEVIFSYNPQASMPATGMRMANLGVMQFSNLIQQRTFSQLLTQHIKTQQDTLLADSGAIASDAGFLVARSGDGLENAMFIRPYAKTIDRSTSGGMGYDGNLYGFVLGYERSLSPELTLGAHAGLGFGTIDFKGDGYDENNEDQTIYSMGLHTAYNPDAWHFDGSATFYMAEHEYDGKTGNLLQIDEDDDYTSYGAELEAIAGYVIPSGNWAVMPYAGLGYSWITADSHSTDADNPDWDTTYGSVDEHIARSILGAQLSGSLMWGEVKVVPTLGVRWEYALTDNNIKVEQSTLGSPSVTAEDDISRSSIIGDASIGFSKGTLNCELGGTAEYNDDYNTYGGWLTLRSAF